MEKLFEFRTAVCAAQFPKLVKCSWPIGRITFYKDCLEVSAGFEKYILKYSDIDYIKANFLDVLINHHNPEVIESIWFDMPFLGTRIKKKIKEFNIPIEIK